MLEARVVSWAKAEEKRMLSPRRTPFVEYTIQVTAMAESWNIRTRYSALRRLHDALVADPDLASLRAPVFPAKDNKHNLESDFIDQRMAALNAWLYDLLLPAQVNAHPLVYEFFQVAEHAAWLAKSSSRPS